MILSQHIFKIIFIIYIMSDKYKENYIKIKKEHREKKRKDKRYATGEEVIFIFEKVLEGWKTVKIYNTIIQNNPESFVDKKKTEVIATGNCKVYPTELSSERFNYYNQLRIKVYEYNKQKTIIQESIDV